MKLFTRPHVWDGGTYDLAIELGARDDDHLLRALRAVWSHGDLEGCYRERDREPCDQARVEPDLSCEVLHGVARLGGGAPIPCRTIAIQFMDGFDWLHVSFSVCALGLIFDLGAYPFENGDDLSWRIPVDGWLVALAHRIHAVAPFRLGLVGIDGSHLEDATAFHAGGLPDERWVGFVVPDAGTLRWHPANRGAPMSLGD